MRDSNQIDLPALLQKILAEYSLPLNGLHGVAHWARALENGVRLAEITGAQLEVVQYFAILHDCRRINESTDPGHGQRGADFAKSLRDTLISLSDHDFNLLYRACAGHTHERTHPNVTIQTCWDADRLDLGRVGVMPHPSRLCTEAAKAKEMIQWADGRASFQVVPEFVAAAWGIELK